MSTLEETAKIFPDLSAALNEIRNYREIRPELARGDFKAAAGGDMNLTLLSDNYVLRVPHGTSRRRQVASALFEASIIADLGQIAQYDSPVRIPQWFDNCTKDGTPYAVFTKVPGEVLTHQQIKDFSPVEKEAFGRKFGSFVAWLDNNLEPWRYRVLYEEFKPKIYDRADVIATQKLKNLPPGLAKVLSDLKEEYAERQTDGSLEPTIVGHDDLHHGNLAFTRSADAWSLTGVFDFGITKLSSPERELRHIAPYGQIALEAAIDAYETVNVTPLSRDLIRFWAVAQTATVFAYNVRSKQLDNALSKHEDLKVLLPGYTG